MLFSVISVAAVFVFSTAVLTRVLMKRVVLRMVRANQIWDALETDEHMVACE